MEFENKKRKKGFFLLKFFLTAVFISLLFIFSAFAETGEESLNSVPKEYSLLIDELDGRVLENLPEKMHSSDIDELGEAVGEITSFEYLFSFLKPRGSLTFLD